MFSRVINALTNPQCNTVLFQSVRGIRYRYRQFVRSGRKLPPEFKGEYKPLVHPEQLEEYRESQYYLSSSKKSSDKPHVTSQNMPDASSPVSINLKRQFPELLPHLTMEPEMRDPLVESLHRREMMRRRRHIDIPEFHVGTIMAVTQADRYAPGKSNRFVGICIDRKNAGLWTTFALRNVVDQVAVEVEYYLYSLKIQKFEVLKLQRSPDRNMWYLRDAPYEYSTVPFDMVPLPFTPGQPVPVIEEKVKLFPPPWHFKWYLHGYIGIDDSSMYPHLSVSELAAIEAKVDYVNRFDLMKMYRNEPTPAEYEMVGRHVESQWKSIEEFKAKMQQEALEKLKIDRK